jgi:ATP-dependent DNA ligase
VAGSGRGEAEKTGRLIAGAQVASHAFVSLLIRKNYQPMNALLVGEIPTGAGWQFEPKWDGFRCLAFRDGEKIHLQSKSAGEVFPGDRRGIAEAEGRAIRA